MQVQGSLEGEKEPILISDFLHPGHSHGTSFSRTQRTLMLAEVREGNGLFCRFNLEQELFNFLSAIT